MREGLGADTAAAQPSLHSRALNLAVRASWIGRDEELLSPMAGDKGRWVCSFSSPEEETIRKHQISCQASTAQCLNSAHLLGRKEPS